MPYKIFIVSPSLLRMAKMLQRERGRGNVGTKASSLYHRARAYIRAKCSLTERRTASQPLSVFNTHTLRKTDRKRERNDSIFTSLFIIHNVLLRMSWIHRAVTVVCVSLFTAKGFKERAKDGAFLSKTCESCAE